MSSAPESKPSYHLYTYFRSQAAARIRIAAHVKGLALSNTFIDLAAGAHNSESFKALNPSESVPVLVVRGHDGSEFVLTQSVAILEYLEESLDGQEYTPLLPSADRPLDRARVRELVGIVSMDIAPPTNGRIVKKVREIRGEVADQFKFVHEIMDAGFRSYEAMLASRAGRYSIGDTVSLADVCLVPSVDMAVQYKLDMSPYPKIMTVYAELMRLDAFVAANWKVQEDTPEQHRGQ